MEVTPKKSMPDFQQSSIEADNGLNEFVMTQKQKQRKIRKLAQINKELIEKLKQQNEDLTKRISKQKLNPSRSLSVKSPESSQEMESTKKQLLNAYKQIDMYKSTLANLKTKEISIESIDKINQLQNRIKYEQGIIDGLHKEIKYLSTIKQQQEKELKTFQNDEVKNSVAELEKEVGSLKEKIKALKKNAQKRDEIEKKQHAYQIELERSLRKLNDEYYPGKVEQKKSPQNQEFERQKSEAQWQQAKDQLVELKRQHAENNKKIDNIIRQKNREIKATEENELKIKQKSRNLATLKTKLIELTKLVTIKESTTERKPPKLLEEISLPLRTSHNPPMIVQKEKKEKTEENREIKKWIIPEGYCFEKGTILPESVFFSDKVLLKESKKNKIIGVSIWRNESETPCLFQFRYKNEKGETKEGNRPPQSLIQGLEEVTFKMSEGDHLSKVKGYFSEHSLTGIQFVTKLGEQISIKSAASVHESGVFIFEPKGNETLSSIFGAYVQSKKEIRICHLGCEFN